MNQQDLLGQLVDALRCLPGVGPKSAQRMAFHLLERNREGGRQLGKILDEALKKIGRCELCRNFTEEQFCRICASNSRNKESLCIVESPADVLAIEQAINYQGRYFVLLGHLSPLDGIGPEQLGLDRLKERLTREDISEVIIATNPTVEGEATAYYIQQLAQSGNAQVSRIAHGVPLGGELEYTDASTLAHAFGSRLIVE